GAGGRIPRRSCFAGGIDVVRNLERPAEAQLVQIPRRARLMSRRQPPMVSRMIRKDASTLRFARVASPSLLALVIAAGLAGPALAQTTPEVVVAPPADTQAEAATQDAAPERIRINRILVRGNQRIDQTTVLSYLPIQPGDEVDPGVLDVAVRTLTRTELFADVQLGVQANGDLVVDIVENPIINQVVFEGNSALNDNKLSEEVTLRPRGIYTRARVQEDVGKIVELYRLSGRISATVTPK